MLILGVQPDARQSHLGSREGWSDDRTREGLPAFHGGTVGVDHRGTGVGAPLVAFCGLNVNSFALVNNVLSSKYRFAERSQGVPNHKKEHVIT